ncbi:MAG TPA: M28 family peptidase [Thermomicrobiales bacterium]|nr:M28 family peptidase [Thermomicrobiales bacterium]
MTESELLAMEKEILATIWTSNEAYETLRILCDEIGHRFGGSESERRGAEFLKQKMEEYGLENVRIEEFPMATWERGAAKLTLLEPVEREFSCISLPYCPAADLTAELLDVGDGEEDDFERLGDQVRGKIVISAAETNRPGERGSHRTDKYRWALERGAAGYIYVNQNPGLLHITGSLPGRNQRGSSAEDREAPIPAIGVSKETGSMILRLMERGGGKARMQLENKTIASTSRNVIGEIIGTEYPEEVILLGGHFDGHDISQGAGDDGAGTVTGLEAGRALAQLKGRLKRTIRVICFGSEELGLHGAWHHADETDPDSYRFVMNLDGAGRGRGGQERLVLSGWPELVDYFSKWAREHHYEFTIQDQLNSHSDHFPFAVRGIPNGTLNSLDATAGMVGRGWGHTEADTFDKIHPRGLQMSAALAARLALTMSQDDDFPAKRRSVEDTRRQLEEAGLLARLEDAGRVIG